MIIPISYNRAPNCTNDWISRPEVLQTCSGLCKVSGLRCPEDEDSMGRPLKYQYYSISTRYHYPEKILTIPVYWCQLLQSSQAYWCPPPPGVKGTPYAVNLINFPYFLAIYNWESYCNRHVGWKFFCFTWGSIKMLT